MAIKVNIRNPSPEMVTFMYISKCVIILELDPPPHPNKQIITSYKSNNLRQLRRSISPAAGVFLLGLKLTKSKLEIVYIIENYYNVNNWKRYGAKCRCILCCAERLAVELTQPVLTAWSLAAGIRTQPFACTQYFATESTLLWKWLTLEDSHILYQR